jgi:hypothetical protein
MTDQPMTVRCEPTTDGWHCSVTVGDDPGATTHEVSVDRATLDDMAPGVPPEELVRTSFEFLLEREPRQSTLRSVELPLIGRFFGHYRAAMERRLVT